MDEFMQEARTLIAQHDRKKRCRARTMSPSCPLQVARCLVSTVPKRVRVMESHHVATKEEPHTQDEIIAPAREKCSEVFDCLVAMAMQETVAHTPAAAA